MKRKTTKILIEKKSPYNPMFVEKILVGKKDRGTGKYTRITLDEIYNEQK